MHFYACGLVFSLFIFLPIANANTTQRATYTIPADYIIAGNLNHELGQRWLKARSLKGQGEFEQARIQYVVLLDTYPDLIQARFEYVQVLDMLGKFKEMESELESLLELDPLNFQYKQTLGILLFEHGEPKQGFLLLEDVWHDRQSVDLGTLLYRTYMSRGEKQKALPVLEYLYKQSVDDVYLQEELFVLYIELGDDLKAQNFAPTFAENSPVSLRRFVLAAQLHGRLGLDHLAADYWQAVLKKQPDYQLAHEKLVQYYTENSREGEALPHKIFLYGHSSEEDGVIAGEIGDYYVKISECSQAVFFLKQSLQDDPTQVDRMKGLAYCYKTIGEIDEAAFAFNAYFKLQPSPSSSDRLVGAQVFVEAGMVNEAVHQYLELLVENPGDVDLLVALAEVETRRGNLTAALVVWKQVAGHQPNNLECRIQILSLSEQLGITDIHSVLEEIHALDQNNHRVSLLLALAAFHNGHTKQGGELFKPLADREFFSSDLLALRGEIFFTINQPERSYVDFTEALQKDVNLDENFILSLLQVAGKLGRLDLIRELNGKYDFSGSKKVDVILKYADALASSGDFETSIVLYNAVLASDVSGLHKRAYLGLSNLYAQYNFGFEAEQENRLNWLNSQNIDSLLHLVNAALQQQNNGEAEYWLDQYTITISRFDPAVYLADMQLLLADGDADRALVLADEFSRSCLDAGVDCSKYELLVSLEKAHILFLSNEIAETEQLLALLQQKYPLEIRPTVYLLKLAILLKDEAKIRSLSEQLLLQVSFDSGDLFTLHLVAREYGLDSFSNSILRKLYKEHPKSLKYGLSLVAALLDKSSFDEAMDVIRTLQLVYPDVLLLKLYGAETSLAMGEFDHGLIFVSQIKDPVFFKIELIRARLLWGLFKWDDALSVYENNLVVDAESSFLAECEHLNIDVPMRLDPSLWGRIVQPLASRDSLLENSFVNTGDGFVNGNYSRVGTTYFSQKRWQDLFKLELDARRSVRKGEYFHAVNQYEAMGDSLDEPTLLFDLAGIYSSLNRVGDEAVVYEKINTINPDFPGLARAMTRNQLRRRPRTGVLIEYTEEDGRDGYKDIQQWKQEVHGWYSPKPRREGFLSASHLYYDGDKGESVHGHELLVGVTSNVLDYFKLDMVGGVHLLRDDSPSKSIFDISITGLAGDYLKSSIRVKRDVVKDTLASLHRGITSEEYTVQASMDLFPRLQVGGKLSFADYSDDNDMSGYSFWGLFTLQTQPDYLYVKMGYEFIDHQDGSGGTGPLLSDGFQENDHPYWAPVNYWRNRYTFGYKHTYSDDLLGHQIPGFLSAKYLIDYDSDGELFHHFSTGVHLEISESWIFSFNGSVAIADEYNGYNLGTSFEYRW